MPYDANRKLIMFKIETTEGVNAVPVVGTDSILSVNFQPGFLEAEAKIRQLDRPFYGAEPEVQSKLRRTAQFSVEMAGSGTAATPPAWMKLNRVCGFNAGVATTTVVQSPISSAIPSATLQYNWGDLDMPSLGTRGSFGFTIEDDEIPLFNYNMTGVPPVALATEVILGTPVYTAFRDPVLASTENTTFTLDGFALPLRRIEVSGNSTVDLRSLIGPVDYAKWENRSLSGSIVCEVPAIAAKNYFSLVRPGTQVAMNIVHGVGAGNIVTLAAPKVQITAGITMQEEQGVVMMTLPIKLIPNAGNDELIITTS